MRDGAGIPQSKLEEIAPKSGFGAGMTVSETSWSNFLGGYLADSGAQSIAMVAPPTAKEGAKDLYRQAGLQMAISADTEHPEAAALFLDYVVNSEKAGEIFGTTLGFPASSSKLDGAVLVRTSRSPTSSTRSLTASATPRPSPSSATARWSRSSGISARPSAWVPSPSTRLSSSSSPRPTSSSGDHGAPHDDRNPRGAPAGAGGSTPAPRRRRALQRREDAAGYLFLTPWLIGFFLLTAGPILFSLYLAFTNYSIFGKTEFIGLDNFSRMMDDEVWWGSVRITLLYVLVGTPIKLLAALAVAMLLNYRSKGTGFFRSAFYAPSLIGASVSIAIVWRAMFSTGGPVDSSLRIFGIDIGGWVGIPALILPMMILLAVWQFGAPMVIFLAGLKQVPAELYEAASVDGAGPLGKFRNVTLPMLSPVIFFNLLLEMIHAFQVFASAYIIGSGTGGPAGATNFYTVYLYTRAFTNTQMGYASAMAWVLLIAVGIIAVIMFRTSNSWVHYSGDKR